MELFIEIFSKREGQFDKSTQTFVTDQDRKQNAVHQLLTMLGISENEYGASASMIYSQISEVNI